VSQLGLRNLNEHEYQIAEYLIGNIDEDGYLRRDMLSIEDDLAFSMNIQTSQEELLRLLKEVQELDPPGIGARDLQECLLIQLRRKEYQTVELKTAAWILKECMDEISKKHYDKISKKLEITDQELKDAIKEILKLNPKPGNSQSDSPKSTQHIIPDFIFVSGNAASLQQNQENNR
jgi:RNA polymerase sigma-54 factor